MKKIALKAIRESFKTYDETVVSYLKLLMTISGGTIALRLKDDVSDPVAKIGLVLLLLPIVLGALCIHFLLMQKKADNQQSLAQDSVAAEKEQWGKSALQMYKFTIVFFLAGLFLLIISG